MEAILQWGLYIIVLPLIYWCINEKKCLSLGIVVIVSVWLNLLLEVLLGQRVLPEYNPLPGGWIIVGVLLGIYLLVGKRIEKLFAARSPRVGMVSCAALAFVMILYRPSAEMAIPGALLLGWGSGYFLNNRYVGFTATEVLGRTGVAKYLTLLARFLTGSGCLVLLFAATEKIVVNLSDSGNYHLYVFMRYALLSIWVSAGAPWLFRFLRLAKCETKGSTEGDTDNG